MSWKTQGTDRAGWTTSLIAGLLAALLWTCPAAGQDAAEEESAPAKVERKEPRGRLPAYYGRIVDAKQREQIYRIQAGFEKQIQKLRAELEKLLKQRDQEVRDVLTPEQQKELDAMVEAARQKRSRRSASRSASPSDSSDNPDAADSGEEESSR